MKKKFLLTLCLLFVFLAAWAGKFVLIPVTENNNLENLFENTDLKIHYYCDHYVLATTENLNFEGIAVLDEEAFVDCEGYYIIYCPPSQRSSYLTEAQQAGKVLYSNDNFLLVKRLDNNSQLFPAKNDGMVHITQQRAYLPTNRFDYPVVTEPDANVTNLVSQVSTPSVISYVQSLEDFGTRVCNHTKSVSVQNWIKSQYESFGLYTYVHNVTGVYPWWGGSAVQSGNVIAIQPGTDPLLKNEYIVLGGHHDTFTYEDKNNATGADDDATGTAGVMEVARILSQYDFKRSIIYCAFTAEECGLDGSGQFAQKCKTEGMNILGYFNLDMTGYLTPGDPIHFSLIYPNSALTLADYFVNICDVYFPTVPVTRHANLSWGDSDHTSFNQKGYKGIWWFEDINCDSPYIHHIPGGTAYGGCGNPCTGTIPCLGDKIGPSVNNPEQVKVFTQALVASIATLAVVDGEIPPPLNPPKECKAEYVEGKCIKVSWEAPDESTPDEYHIYRENVSIAQQTALFYTDTVADYENHCYKVKAIYGAQESLFSNTSCASVPPPPPPTNCNAAFFEEMSIEITWNAPEKDTPDKYLVYRDKIKIAQSVEQVYMDTVSDYLQHCYKITAIYDDYESVFSNESCAQVPVGITNHHSNYSIYPNPANSELRVTSYELQVTEVAIYDVYGKMQKSRKAEKQKEENEIIVDISHLAPGIYFVKINNETMRKFIKN